MTLVVERSQQYGGGAYSCTGTIIKWEATTGTFALYDPRYAHPGRPDGTTILNTRRVHRWNLVIEAKGECPRNVPNLAGSAA